MNHLNDQLILHYLADSASEAEQEEIEEHLLVCRQCLGRARSLGYMRKHFDRLWDAWTPQEHGRLSREQEVAASPGVAPAAKLPEPQTMGAQRRQGSFEAAGAACVIEMKDRMFASIQLNGRTTMIGSLHENKIDKWKVKNQRWPQSRGMTMGPVAGHALPAEAQSSRAIRMELEFTRSLDRGDLTLQFQIMDDDDLFLFLTLDRSGQDPATTPAISVSIEYPGLETIRKTVVATKATHRHLLGKVDNAADKSVRVRLTMGQQVVEESAFTIRS